MNPEREHCADSLASADREPAQSRPFALTGASASACACPPPIFAVAGTQTAGTHTVAVEQGAGAQSAAIAPSANAPLPVETVPERQQELSPARSTSSDETLSPIEVESKKTLPKSPPLVPLQWPTRGNAAALTHGALPVSKIGSSASSAPYR